MFVPADPSQDNFFTQLVNSVRKFHTEEELPILRYDLANVNDQTKWYKAKPLIARELIKDYETVIGMDVDQIVVAPINNLWEDKDIFDVGVVLNDPSFPIQTWDIMPYFNNGLVVMKSKDFIDHWWRLCESRHFMSYQYREQDLLNILASDYMNYKVNVLDGGNEVYGEFAKPFWAEAYLRDNRLYFKLKDVEKEIKVIHFGGGGDINKGNYRIRFSPEVVKRIEELTK